MKVLIIIVLLLHFICPAIAQKKELTDSSFKNWSYIRAGSTRINKEGTYFIYQIANKPIGKNTLVLAATDKSWQKEFIKGSNSNFSTDGNFFYVMQADTLVSVNIPSKRVNRIPDCSGYKLHTDGKTNWLILQSRKSKNEITIQNVTTNTTRTYQEVIGYEVNPNMPVLILRSKKDAGEEVLKWLNLTTGETKEIYTGSQANRIIFDQTGKNLAFYTIKDGNTSLWYYKIQQNSAEKVVDGHSEGIDSGYVIATDIWKFSNDGDKLFFNQKLNEKPQVVQKNLVVWDYRDAYLKNIYKASSNDGERNLTMLNLPGRKVIHLLSGMQKADLFQPSTEIMVVTSSFGRTDELPWNMHSRISYYLLFTKTGELRTVKENSTVALQALKLSPDNKFLLYYDPQEQTYLSYNINSRQVIKLDKLAGGASGVNDFRRNMSDDSALGVSYWISDSNRAIIQGKYDLWEVDVTGKNKPVNLTKNGLDDHIVFSSRGNASKIDDKLPIYITGFDENNKTFSLYNLNIAQRKVSFLCSSTSSFGNIYDPGQLFLPSKKGVLIQNQTVSSAINYSFLTNFKYLTQLTDIHPEKDYNWISSELIKYKDQDGQMCEGMLFKPKNFDSTKRYPVIFHYYWDNSRQLNTFILPEPQADGINIPLLVSSGYLFFWPNIYKEDKKPGESGLKSILAGADHLSRFDWVDTSRMALSGHSWGGYVTNYVVTHSNRFKAAVSAAGVISLPELYNELWRGVGNKQGFVKEFFGMVDGLESDKDNYISNSPLFSVQQVATPLLIMHNVEDSAVDVKHSTELFVQLRSLNKPAWLLQYENEGHVLIDPANKLDFQRKMMAFFDHYLKDEPLPKWMNEPIAPLK